MSRDLYDLRVAMVLDDHRVVLNAGTKDGVRDGMSFIIYSIGPEITDPIDHRSLGRLEIVKGKVWVHQTAAEHSVAGDNPDPAMTRTNALRLSVALGSSASIAGVKIGDLVKRVS